MLKDSALLTKWLLGEKIHFFKAFFPVYVIFLPFSFPFFPDGLRKAGRQGVGGGWKTPRENF